MASVDKTPPPQQHHINWSTLVFLALLLIFNVYLVPAMRPQQVRAPYSVFIDEVDAEHVANAVVTQDQITYALFADAKTPLQKSEVKTRPKSGPTALPKSTATALPQNAATALPTSGATARPENEATALPNGGVPPLPSFDAYRNVYVTTPLAQDMELPKLLREHDVRYSVQPPDRGNFFTTLIGWVVPPLLFVGFWMWMMRRAQGGTSALSLGRSKARIYNEGDTGVTFDQVAGVEEAKAELKEVVDFLSHPTPYIKVGARIPRGVLLIGPPGTGKTLLARAVAGEAKVPFFTISGSEFIELFVGMGAARVRDLFVQAKAKAPCIVFIDELDALGKMRGGPGGMMGGNDEREQTLNQLLTDMDGFQVNVGVIILAATNRPEVLDPALRRPGRFDRTVLVDLPDRSGRAAILSVHLKKVQADPDLAVDAVAVRTPGFSGADLANLVNEAALRAVRQGRATVTTADCLDAMERVVAGLEKRSRVLNREERDTVAHHESGHAIVGSVMPGTGRVEKISIVPRGAAALGYTLQLPEEDRFLLREDEVRGRLAGLLGGRAGEEVAFGRISTGASDDIQKATDLAERCVTLYGMSPSLGPMALERVQDQFLDGGSMGRRPVSQTCMEEIDREVRRMLDEAHRAAVLVLEQNRALVEEMAAVLLDREVLEGDALRQLLSRAVAPAAVAAWLKHGQALPEAQS